MTLFLFVVGVVGVAILFNLWDRQYEKSTIKKLRRVASELNLSFEPKLTDINCLPCSTAKLFEQGHTAKAIGVMSSTVADVKVLLMDYRYETGSGDDRAQNWHTVAAFHVPGLMIPSFTLRKETLLSRVADKLGSHDIDFQTHPDFSHKYRLKGDNECAIRVFFNSRLLDAFEQDRMDKSWVIEGSDDWLVVYTRLTGLYPKDWPDFYQRSFDRFNQIAECAQSRG